MQHDELRAAYRPSAIRVLFVGEAPPAGGTFFYAANSQVYRYLKEVLEPHLGWPTDFLAAFAARGYFLDDLVTEPVDHIPLGERTPIFRKSVPLLAHRLREYRPQLIVTVLKRIEDHVEESRQVAGIEAPHYKVPFPGNGQQANFRRRMAEILPHFPTPR
jgi:hypothetical protein